MLTALTRREENRLNRQAAIVAIARRSFLENGYAATSMSTIAAEIGGSKATLWAHFPSKEALFAAVLDDLSAHFRRELEDALRPGRDLRTTLMGFGERFAAKLTSPASLSLHRLIVGEGGRFPEIGIQFAERGPSVLIEHVGAYLAGEMAKGELRQADPRLAARHLVSFIQALQQTCLWNPAASQDAAAVSDYVRTSVDAFMRAYAPEADPAQG
jgi:AcrR family transcriptional regulator